MSTIEVNKITPVSGGTAVTIGDSGDTFTVPTGAGLTVTDEVKTNKISPASGTTFTLGDSGDTFNIPSGATIANAGTATGFGESNTPGWLATMTGVQSISNATYTTVQFNTESDGYDTDSGFNTGTYTYTVPSGEGGKYFLTSGIYIHSNSNHEYGIKFVTSAGDRGERFIAGINRDVGVVPATTTIQSLNAGQTVYVQVYQNTGSSKNTSYGIKNCWFGGFKISS